MQSLITEIDVIQAARSALILLDEGKQEEAKKCIVEFRPSVDKITETLDPDVHALWLQTEIAVSNPTDQRYFDHTKEELNRVTFRYKDKWN